MIRMIATKKGFYKGLRLVGALFLYPKEIYLANVKSGKKPKWFEPVEDEKPATVAFASSTDEGCSVEQAIEQINKMKTVELIEKFVVGDDRAQIKDAAALKIGRINAASQTEFEKSQADGCTVKKAAAQILTFKTVDEVEKFCIGDKRDGVQKAAKDQIAALTA